MDDESMAARDAAVEKWLPLVWKVARTKFPWAFNPKRNHPEVMNIDGDDLIQEGSIVLMRLLRDFDPDRQVDFEEYAWNTIYYAMLQYVQANGPRIPTTKRPKQSAAMGSERLREQLAAVRSCVAMSEISPKRPMEDAFLNCSLQADAEQGVENVDNKDFLRSCMKKLRKQLSPHVIRALVLHSQKVPLKEIAAELCVSHETVRKWLARARKVVDTYLKDEAKVYRGR
jgi:RNA polymerase sigma factor (sigma-70 family)